VQGADPSPDSRLAGEFRQDETRRTASLLELDDGTPSNPEEHLSDTLKAMDVAFPRDPLTYPFDVPSHSFLWLAGGIEALSSSNLIPDQTTRRYAVLAIGSNAAPTQLSRKFSDDRFLDPSSPNGCIPVLTAEVDGVDVVYGAHLAPYGAIPATLVDTVNSCAHVFVTWLTSTQLERMHETEGLGHAYQLRRITGVRSQGKDVDDVVSYVTIAGVAVLDGGPLGLESVHTPGSHWPRGTQRQAWDILSLDMGCGPDGKDLFERVLHSPLWRERVETHLASHRLPETQAPVVTWP
jgi:hypothetical protein